MKTSVEVPNFYGFWDPSVVLDWLVAMDQYFELEEITDPERVRFTTTKLKKTAGLWWAHVRQKREQEEKRYEEQEVLKFKD